ncbi:MAG: septum formation initiator family protein [Syntrophomonadaceae bacterium]|nr:septum formation initiator family protein [Syntrophomonadaceae bacterium]
MRRTIKLPRIIRSLCMLVITAMLLAALVPRISNIVDLSQRGAMLEQEKIRLTEINQKLVLEAKAAESPETVERIAREQLGMVKKGERPITPVIYD